MAEVLKVDAVVIGSGPGGYPAGIRLGQLGVKTIVVEKEKPGGVCLNVGCIPSKALIHAAKTYDKMKHAGDIGISVKEPPTIDWSTTLKWKDGVVSKLTNGVKALLKANGAEYLEGEATFVTSRAIDVKKKDGSVQRIEAKSIVVATGSRPTQIPGFTASPDGGKRVIDSTGGLATAEIPKRLVVVGGGYIGIELGTVYAKLGSKVTVVEALPSILTGMDTECVAVVARKLKKLGVEVMLNTKAKSWEEKGDRAVVSVELDGKLVALDADKILVTVGRRPNTDGALGLDKVGVKLDPKGFVVTDKQQRTNVPGVYAIGDCATGMMLAHKATKEGEVVAEVIAGRKGEFDARTIPFVVFSDPEIAGTGLTEDEAQQQAKATGRKLKVGKYPFSVLGRALSVNDTDGFAKIIADADTEEVLGVQIVGGAAADLISEAALAIEMGAVLHDISLTIHPHPSLPEALMEAAAHALGEAIHLVNK